MKHDKDIPAVNITTVYSVLIAFFAIAALVILLFIPDKQLSVARTGAYSVMDQVKDGDTRFSVKLPPQVREENISVSELEDRPYRGFELRIHGFLETDLLEHPLSGNLEAIDDVEYSRIGRESVFTISTEDMREISYEVNDGRLDVILKTPSEIYDHILVIDAGHGGDDTGFVAGEDAEKDITLAIVLKLKERLDREEDIKVFYTRLQDESLPDTARIGFANEIGADLFLSVHLSSTASGRISMINGISAYYNPGDEASETFAGICHDKLLEATGALDKGVKNVDDDIVITLAQMPAARVECGFITSEKELSSLKSDRYQDKIADALYKAIISSIKEKK